MPCAFQSVQQWTPKMKQAFTSLLICNIPLAEWVMSVMILANTRRGQSCLCRRMGNNPQLLAGEIQPSQSRGSTAYLFKIWHNLNSCISCFWLQCYSECSDFNTVRWLQLKRNNFLFTSHETVVPWMYFSLVENRPNLSATTQDKIQPVGIPCLTFSSTLYFKANRPNSFPA